MPIPSTIIAIPLYGFTSDSDVIELTDSIRLEKYIPEKIERILERYGYPSFQKHMELFEPDKEDSNLSFNDWSLREPFDSDKAEYIRRGIRERIRQSTVTVVFLSAHTAASRWVNWEIEETISMGKGVVGMYSGEPPPALLPAAITRHNIPVVQWNQKELAKAIERQAKG